MISRKDEVFGDAFPAAGVMPIGAGYGFVKNIENTRNSGPRQPRATTEMSKLAFNLRHCRSRLGKSICVFVQGRIQFLKSINLLHSAFFACFHRQRDLLRQTQRACADPDLLAGVAAILHQRFGNQHKPAAGGEQKRDPRVMKLPGRNRTHGVEVFPAKCEGGPGDDGVVAQDLYALTIRKLFLIRAVQSKTGPQAQTERPGIIIDHVGIAEGGDNLAGPFQRCFERLQFVRIPNIILIRQSNNFPLTQRDALFEIPGRTQIHWIALDSNWEGYLSRKVVENFDGAIGRSIVADNEFIRAAILSRNRVQLRFEKRLAIKCAHRNGDEEWGHFCALASNFSKVLKSVSISSVPSAEVCLP
jgi:hypothetical protein